MISERRLLIVEPDAELRDALTEILADVGLVVDAVPDADAAAERLTQRVYALVIADVDRQPFDFAGRATQLVRAAAPVRVVAMTTLRYDELAAARLGVAGVLSKPFSVEELFELIADELPTDGDGDARALVDAYFGALSRNDWETLGALCSADVTYELPGAAPYGRTVRGRDAFRAFSADTFSQFPEARFTVQQLLPLVSGAVARYRGSWRGAKEPIDGAVFFGFEGPFIRRIKVQLDLDRLLAIAPPPTHAPA